MLVTDRFIDTELITIRKQSARERAAAAERQMSSSVCCEVGTGASSADAQVISLPQSAAEAAASYAQGIRKSLKIDDGNVILLAVAWITDDARRMFTMHPEVLASDVTEQTNKEKRGLLLLAGLTSDKKSFTVCQTFLPSSCRWVFDWYFSTALPILLPERARLRNRLFLTDGDSNEYDSFIQAMPQFFPNSKHRLCAWHLIDRGMKASGLLNTRESSSAGSQKFRQAVRWILSWSTDIETHEEFFHSYNLFLHWLSLPDTVEALESLARRLKIFVVKKLYPLRHKWVRPFFFTFRTFDRKTTQFIEAENSVLKTGPGGCKPTQSLCTAGIAMTELNELRINRKYVDAADALDRVPTDAKWPDFENNCNAHVVRQVTMQYSLARKCRVRRESNSTFLVLFSPNERNLQTAEEAVIPRYTRVREVRIVFLEDGSPTRFLKCSCCTFERFGYPCRHIYAVLQREPHKEDVVSRYHKIFMHFYGASDESLTDTFDQAIDNEPPGPVFTEEEWPQENHFGESDPVEVADLRRILSAEEPTLRCDVVRLCPELAHRNQNSANVAAPFASSLQTEVKLSQAVCRTMTQQADSVEDVRSPERDNVSINSMSREEGYVNSSEVGNASDNEWVGNASDNEWAGNASDNERIDASDNERMNESDNERMEESVNERMDESDKATASECECADTATECADTTTEHAKAARAQRRSEWLKQNNYAKFHPLFQNMIKIVDGDFDAYEEMVREFQGLEFRLAAIAANNKKGDDSEPQKGIVSSNLPLERKRRSKRAKPLGSP
jgi:hypothetical protein